MPKSLRILLTLSLACLLRVAGLAQANDWSKDEFQFKFTFDNPLAVGIKAAQHSSVYVYIPPTAKKIRALLLLQENVVEQMIAVHPAIREVCDRNDIAIAWDAPGFDLTFIKNQPVLYQMMHDQFLKFGRSIGYPELADAPLIAFGHSNTTAYCQNIAEFKPERVLSVIATHGWNGVESLNQYHGPVMEFVGSYWELKKYAKELTTNKGVASIGPVRNRLKRGWLPISVVEQYGDGHFDYADSIVRIFGQFIDKSMKARLGPDGRLQEIDPNSGYVIVIPDFPTPPVVVKPYADASPEERATSGWYFARELAEAVAKELNGNGSWHRATQFIGWKNPDGSIASFGTGGPVNPTPYLLRPGTNHVDFYPTLLPAIPVGLSESGAPVSVGTNPVITMEYDCGPYISADPAGGYFVKPNRGELSGYLVARNLGDAKSRPTVQPTYFVLAGGKRQPAAIPPLGLGTLHPGAVVSLPASKVAGVYRGYYVEHGAARVVGNRLEILPVPVNAPSPIESELVAYDLDPNGIRTSSEAFRVAPASQVARSAIEPPACVIVEPEHPDSIVEYAVAELQHHLQLIGGRAIPIATRAAAGQFPFYVGIKPADDQRPFAAEEARWRVTPEGVWCYGRDLVSRKQAGSDPDRSPALTQKNQAGTLFAVYEFLEDEMGVHWIEPGEAGITFVASPRFLLAPAEGTWTPQLIERHMRTAYRNEMREVALRQGQVPKAMQFSEAEFAQRQFDEFVWQRRMRMGSQVDFTYGHAFTHWWEKYGKTHPEYFALGRNGTRGPDGVNEASKVKMCVSNADFVRAVVKDHFAKGGGPVVNACENDSRNFCRCPDCLALDVRLPGEEHLDVDDAVLTDRYVHFANAVLAEARRVRPDAQTVFYAYSRYNLPPRSQRLSDGVILFLLPNLSMTTTELETYYQGWKDANAKETFLRPNDLCQDTGLPLGFEEHMFTKFKLADRYLALRGTDYDSCWGFWPVSGITNYIMARAFYRPERSFEQWEAEYCGTYGEARDDVRDYYRHWRQVWNVRVMQHLDVINRTAATQKLLRARMANQPDDLYTVADFDATDAMLAHALLQHLSAEQHARVDTLVLANQHNRLTFLATRLNRLGSEAPEGEKRAATRTLAAFRIKHRLDLNMDWETLYQLEDASGDNAGFERLAAAETVAMR